MKESPGLGFTLTSGAAATVTKVSRLHATLHSPEPSPPGSTVRGRVEGVACPLEVKVRSCKRLTPLDLFQIEGRLQNARKDLLERLTGLD